MVSPDDLVRLARDEEVDEIGDRVLALGEDERRSLVAPLTSEARRLWRESEWGAAQRLWPVFLTGATLAELKKLGRLAIPSFGGRDLAFRILDERRPSWLAEWADWLLAGWPVYFTLVRRLVRAGLMPRPDSEAYIVGLIGSAYRQRPVLFAEDPDLLDHEVWRMFEVEGGGEISLAAVDKFTAEDLGWSATLQALAREGRLDRDRLLDASLAALGRDFTSFRAGWFSRFHEALEPTVDERAARADAYARLLTAPVPNTVSFALKALKRLGKEGRLAPTPVLVDRLAPALASDRKATVTTALRLLRGADPEVAALAACRALGHPDAAVQGNALDIVEVGLTAAVRGRLLEVAETVAPTVRGRVAALTGLTPADHADEQEAAHLADLEARAARLPPRAAELAGVPDALQAAQAGDLPRVLHFSVADVPVLASAEPIRPVTDVAELIDTVARLVEQVVPEPAALERALDGLARLGQERPDDFDARTASVRRRAGKLLSEDDGLGILLRAWLDREAPKPRRGEPEVFGPDVLPHARARELAERISAGWAEPLLAAPTHRDGWVDPRAFAARLTKVAEPGRHDLIAALCRLGPDGRDDALAALALLDHSHAPLARAALGGPAIEVDDSDLAAAVDLARRLDAAGPAFRAEQFEIENLEIYAASAVDGDEGLRAAVPALALGRRDRNRYSAEPSPNEAAEVEANLALRPAGHQAFWAEASRDLGLNQDGWSVAYRDIALLAPAVDPDRPLGEIGALVVVIGLSHADATARAAAVDAAIAAIEDGRLDADGLGREMRELLARNSGKPTRLGTALRTVADESPLHAEVVRRATEHAIALTAAPRGLHALLDLLNELGERAGAAVEDPGARALLGTLTGSSKTAKLASALLAREGRSRLADAAAQLALSARLDRAERWAAAPRR